MSWSSCKTDEVLDTCIVWNVFRSDKPIVSGLFFSVRIFELLELFLALTYHFVSFLYYANFISLLRHFIYECRISLWVVMHLICYLCLGLGVSVLVRSTDSTDLLTGSRHIWMVLLIRPTFVYRYQQYYLTRARFWSREPSYSYYMTPSPTCCSSLDFFLRWWHPKISMGFAATEA